MPAASAQDSMSSKYELRQQIGRGSFGAAFLVLNKDDKKDYVLKRVRLSKQTKWQRNSTLQERDLVVALKHPFIVPCVETWMVQDHTVNMIYSFCEKGDLATYLQKVQKQRCQVEEALMLRWLCQLLLALDYLQCKGVLHRDIKSSNLMLTASLDVQLGDFGLATVMQDAGPGSRPKDSNLVGTPHYMSPELLSCKAYGFKTDVWSLGCVFYELTAQRPTFNAFNIHGLVSKITKHKLAPLPDGYSQDWKDIISLMLCKNPSRRPSVQELMALPALRSGMLQACSRAQQLDPSVVLPPLLEPTPFLSVVSSCTPTAAADVAATAAAESSNLPSIEAGSTRGISGIVRAAAQASELDEVLRVSELQQKQEQQDDGALLFESDIRVRCSDGGSSQSSRCSDLSRGSGRAAGGLKDNQSVLAAAMPGRKGVPTPGISMTAAERVAAAIAAARPLQQTTERGSPVNVPAALEPSPSSQIGSSIKPPTGVKAGAWGQANSRQSVLSSNQEKQKATTSARLAGRPQSVPLLKGRVAANLSEQDTAGKSAWQLGRAATAQAGSSRLQQQQQQQRQPQQQPSRQPDKAAANPLVNGQSHTFHSQVTDAIESRAVLLACLSGRGGDDSDDADDEDDLETAIKQLSFNSSSPSYSSRQMPDSVTSAAEADSAVAPDSLASSFTSARHAVMAEAAATRGSAGVADLANGRPMDSAAAAEGATAVSDTYSSVCKDCNHAASGAVTPATQPSMGKCYSSQRWVSAGRQKSPGTAGVGSTAVDSEDISNQEPADDLLAVLPQTLVGGPARASQAVVGPGFEPGSSDGPRQERLQLLESVLQLVGSLYARGRWQELGAVLTTPGLLEAGLVSDVRASMRQRSVLQVGAANPGAGSSSRSKSPSPQKQPAAGGKMPRLGDVVVLGKSKQVKGRIRYVGPVAWGSAGEDWVGMELDSACGVDGMQHGISYFHCPPKCASFFKASQLASC